MPPDSDIVPRAVTAVTRARANRLRSAASPRLCARSLPRLSTTFSRAGYGPPILSLSAPAPPYSSRDIKPRLSDCDPRSRRIMAFEPFAFATRYGGIIRTRRGATIRPTTTTITIAAAPPPIGGGGVRNYMNCKFIRAGRSNLCIAPLPENTISRFADPRLIIFQANVANR